MTKAVLVPVGEMPRDVEINGLPDLQEAVGGRIESCPFVFDDEPSVYVNDEGKLRCQPNRAIYEDGATRDNLIDITFGDFVCIGFDPETGEDRDISDEERAKVFERFGTRASIESGLVESIRIRCASLS